MKPKQTSRYERLLSVPCTYCMAQPNEHCKNVRNGKYARAGKTVTSFHWQREAAASATVDRKADPK